ncbi:hypothetical protein HGRIS_011116 [Hohenbuehelia grisea]|uniref:G domain-containing protein n=1 Tax=Hohenbuehelia grisea TaxID=104357 RepID=A0ABR3IYX1_9AGAR
MYKRTAIFDGVHLGERLSDRPKDTLPAPELPTHSATIDRDQLSPFEFEEHTTSRIQSDDATVPSRFEEISDQKDTAVEDETYLFRRITVEQAHNKLSLNDQDQEIHQAAIFQSGVVPELDAHSGGCSEERGANQDLSSGAPSDNLSRQHSVNSSAPSKSFSPALKHERPFPPLWHENETVIALMGPAGAGKCTFIDIAARRAGHGLALATATVNPIHLNHPRDGRNIVLVHTPGFDDTMRSDTEILKLIAQWLKKIYKSKATLAGIIYVHRISGNCMDGAFLRNLHVFGGICGNRASANVILATTMWTDRLRGALGDQRELKLKERYWKPMLDLGSRMVRFDGTHDSAWQILDALLDRKQAPPPLLIQEELVDLRQVLVETEAGKRLYSDLHQILNDHRTAVRRLLDEARKQSDATVTSSLTARIGDLEKSANMVLGQMDEMKIPMSRRVISIFRRTKTRTVWRSYASLLHYLTTFPEATRQVSRLRLSFSCTMAIRITSACLLDRKQPPPTWSEQAFSPRGTAKALG